MKTFTSIIKPIITEKTSAHQAKGEYTFEVASKKITKIDIKQALEKIYGVPVQSVRTMIRPGKKRQVGRRELLKRRVSKIAIVRFKDKKTIDPNKISDKVPESKKSKPKT